MERDYSGPKTIHKTRAEGKNFRNFINTPDKPYFTGSEGLGKINSHTFGGVFETQKLSKSVWQGPRVGALKSGFWGVEKKDPTEIVEIFV